MGINANELEPTKTTSIGARLSFVVLAVFLCYLVATAVSIFILLHHYRSVDELKRVYIDQAMAASELTRDAEVITAEVFESVLGITQSAEDLAVTHKNLRNIYQEIRGRLGSTGSRADDILPLIDKWQAPYFDSLQKLSQQLGQKQDLKEVAAQRLNRLHFEVTAIVRRIEGNPANPQLANAVVAMGIAAVGLQAISPGLLARMEFQSIQQLQRIKPSIKLGGVSSANIAEWKQLIAALYADRRMDLKTARQALATARETRLLTQKITTSSFNYFMALKAQADVAMEKYQAMAIKTIWALAFALTILFMASIAVVIYIRDNVVLRLNALNDAVVALAKNDHAIIPTEGNDEISAIGRALSRFVSGRNDAEQALTKAHAETEHANFLLQQMNDRLKHLSETDELTQVANRRYFDSYFGRFWQEAFSHQRCVAVLMIDVDHFKSFNDLYGHQWGDICLRQVADTFSAGLSKSADLIARYGGEEFIVLLDNCDTQQAVAVAQRLRAALLELAITHAGSSHSVVSASIGVASVEPSANINAAQLIKQADDALYQAKRSGRNCVCS